MKHYRIIISGGGTGGHIYPAVAIANECKRRWPDCAILFVGAQDRMEMEKVPAAGYDIKGLWISGLQRKFTLSNLAFPFKVINSLWDAHRIIKTFKPQIAIGTGGYASGPLLKMAQVNSIPYVIQEQNSFPGITNKLLAKKAALICVASTGLDPYFPAQKMVLTGNPVRQDLLTIDSKRDDSRSFFNLDPNKKTLLVLGGSLGARRVNELMAAHVNLLTRDVQILWQCGSLYIEKYKSFKDTPGVQVHAFINKMDFAFSAADFIISRAGAGTISELCIVGKPVIFIPSPHVAEDHQTKNAQAVVAKNAAIMIKESALSTFPERWQALYKNQQEQQSLSTNIKKLALPDATVTIVNLIEKLLHG